MTHTKDNIALVEVPEGAKCYLLNDATGSGRMALTYKSTNGESTPVHVLRAPGTWRFVCLSTEMTEEKARMIVERYEQPIGWRADGDESKLTVVTLYRNYLIEKPIPVTFLKATALESFRSFVEFLGLADKEPLAVLVK